MGWTDIILGLFSAGSLIIVALIERNNTKERKRKQSYDEECTKRAKQRAEESRLAMNMQSATLQLSVVCANALTNGHNNGNVERARKAAEEAQKAYEAFVQKLAANALSE